MDNKDKGLFYNAVEREIGLPVSKEIRFRSRQRSEAKLKAAPADGKPEPISLPVKPGTQAKELTGSTDLEVEAKVNQLASNSKVLEEILRICGSCPKLARILEQNR